MPEVTLAARSPLATVSAYAAPGISIFEDGNFTLTQVAGFGRGFEKPLAEAVGKLPLKVGIANSTDAFTVMRIAPQQFWCMGDHASAGLPSECLVTPLSSSRCRIKIEGEKARILLSRCAAVDFDERSFKPGHFVMTGIHHTPVLIHCIEAHAFHLYAMRTFALGVWEWLVDAAGGLNHE